jgi:hypothetical protein
MAFEASDKQKFTNLPPMRQHQRGLDRAAMKKDPLKMPGGAGGGEDMGGGMDESPEETVAAHGPANVVHVTHDHAAGKHHVHSEHEDGHATESDHETPEAAHDHGKALAMGAATEPGEGEMEGSEYE